MNEQGAAWRGSDSGHVRLSMQERHSRFVRARRRARAKRLAREREALKPLLREELMKSLGLTKVRGNLGGIYYE